MPLFEIGKCCCCEAENTMTVFKMGYLDGVVYCGRVCLDCAAIFRKEWEKAIKRGNYGGSESQERTPEK